MTSRLRHLNRAPIREALIDINVALPESVSVSSLRSHFEPLWSAAYPKVKERRSFMAVVGPFGSDEPAPAVSASGPRIDGFFFASENDQRMVQVRLDGFTTNHLRPYESFDVFQQEAKDRWVEYRDAVQPERILRMGLRYINELQLPDDFCCPSGLGQMFDFFSFNALTGPQKLEGFSLRISLDREEIHAKGSVVINVPAANVNDRQVIFDIDVYRAFGSSPSEDELWTTLRSLHEWKNEIFFGWLKEEYVAQYER